MPAKFALTLAIAVLCLSPLSGCKRAWKWVCEPKAAATPAPTPKPTPIWIPQKRMEVSKLFNGMLLRSQVATEPGGTATQEESTEGSYSLELNVKVKVPTANRDLRSLSKLNEALPTVLPGLTEMLPQARVSDRFEDLYARKVLVLQRNLARLDALLSRHNFFDCETILELRHPATQRAALLLQADMDVDTDGSDPDRLPVVNPSDPTFQPMTSYRWPKRTVLNNPFLPGRQARLKALENEVAQSKALGEPRLHALRESVGAARYEVNLLKTCSFLLAETDPYVVLPGLLAEGMDPAFQARVGDYCAVICGSIIYPAIVGDIGPRDVVGEASLRIGKAINPLTTALTRAVSPLKVTYLYFPNTAEKPFGPPDLPRIRERVAGLLNELGGFGGTLYTWEELSKPAPLPTPTPTPTPVPTPTPPLVPVPYGSGTATPALPSIGLPGGIPVITTPQPSPKPVIAPPTPVPSQTPQPAPVKPSVSRKSVPKRSAG
jgi:hypothetical protein